MTPPGTADGGFLASARVVSGLTLLSRVLGLARDVATAHVLGAGVVNDALTYAWTVPNAFRRLFGEGALGSAFVPVFTRTLEQRGREAARTVANQVISACAAFLLGLTVLLIVLTAVVPDSWLGAIFGAAHEHKVALMVTYTQLLLPYLMVICVVAQLMAVLHGLGEFAVPAVSPIILNVVWLGGVGIAAWWAAGATTDVRSTQGLVIVVAILIASVLQLLWLLPKLSRLGMGFRLVRPRRSPELSAVVQAMGPMLLGMGCAQVNVLADRTIAMAALPDGGTTHLYYGMRLMQFPLGLVSVALVTTVYPALARLMSRQDSAAMTATAGLALRANLLVTLPAAAGLMVLARPIVGLIFEGGAFDATSAGLTSRALLGYAVGLPFAGSVMLLTRACYAAGDVVLPLRVGLAAVIVNVALDLALVGPLAELGLAAATSITALLNAALLLYGFRARAGLARHQRLLAGLLPAALLTVAVGLAAAGADAAVASVAAAGRAGLALRVAAGVGAGLGVFVLLAGRLCPMEWRALTARGRAAEGGSDDRPVS